MRPDFLSDEHLSGGTPDDYDDRPACDLCQRRGPAEEFTVEVGDDPDDPDVFVSCKDREACALRLRVENEELTSGYEAEADDYPW